MIRAKHLSDEEPEPYIEVLAVRMMGAAIRTLCSSGMSRADIVRTMGLIGSYLVAHAHRHASELGMTAELDELMQSGVSQTTEALEEP